MGKSIYVDLEDVVINWAKVFEETRDMTGYKKNARSKGSFEDCNGAYTVQVELTEEAVQQLEEAGSAKEYRDGKGNIKDEAKFVKKHEVYNKDGEVIPFLSGPPEVARADGTPWDIHEDGLIGNGTTAVVRIEVYDMGDGETSTKLAGIQVVDLVEYDGDFTPRPKGFADRSGNKTKAAPAKKKPASKPSKKTEEIPDDDIPF